MSFRLLLRVDASDQVCARPQFNGPSIDELFCLCDSLLIIGELKVFAPHDVAMLIKHVEVIFGHHVAMVNAR